MVKTTRGRQGTKIVVPHPHDWRTTDEDEINKRRLRAQTEAPRIKNLTPEHPVFSNFRVDSDSGMTYTVEIRSLLHKRYACNCVDFRVNGLGTCKHIEATLLHLEASRRRYYQQAKDDKGARIDIVMDSTNGSLRVEKDIEGLPRRLRNFVGRDGRLLEQDPQRALDQLQRLRLPQLRVSQEVDSWLEARRVSAESRSLRHEYELKVQSGVWPAQETRVPLYPYQRQGMLHLAFKERALLADEMGLGKTIQAIAACAVLHRLGKASRVLVVTPASLKTEWEEQIQRFTSLAYQLIFGSRRKRLPFYAAPKFFNVVNYEQIVRDVFDVNATLQPEVVILDEAQRIKNWHTKTAQAVKRLESRYAFVLTGTPIENRIDELHSLMDFLNPSVLGPLFRFNREFYELDDRGRPNGYRNLEALHERVKPYMLRRRKSDVETELPDRTDRTFFVPLSREQWDRYEGHERQVARLVALAKRRPLSEAESKKLMRELAMMRMVCDTNYILEEKEQTCPKLKELAKLLEECRDNPDMKVLVFSEWERMLVLVRRLCERLEIDYAFHTGSVPQLRRRAEIRRFKQDADCRVFLSTDSGSTGLNLQDASVVINCDLPWNPARLEQRIARAWRKHQTQPVTVVNLVSEETIEHRMLDTLASKQALADGVLDLHGDLSEIRFRGGRQALMEKLGQLIQPERAPTPPQAGFPGKVLPADRSLGFSLRAKEAIGSDLIRCEERYPLDSHHSVVVAIVERDAQLLREKLEPLFNEFVGAGQSDPLCPVKLEVIDRATEQALARLIDAGLLAPTMRAKRALYPNGEVFEEAPLSEEERQRSCRHRQQASRKLKMARLLYDGDLEEESQPAIAEATLLLARALAVENRLPEPRELSEVIAPPIGLCWNDAFPVIREVASRSPTQSPRVFEALERLLAEGHLPHGIRA